MNVSLIKKKVRIFFDSVKNKNNLTRKILHTRVKIKRRKWYKTDKVNKLNNGKLIKSDKVIKESTGNKEMNRCVIGNG